MPPIAISRVILNQFGVDKSRLAEGADAQPRQAEDRQRADACVQPVAAPMLTEAWTLGSLEFGAGQIRTGFALLALVSDEELSRIVRDISKELQKIEPDALRKELPAIMEDSLEDSLQPAAAAGAAPGAPGAPKAGGKTPNLDQFTVNLTENAKKGKIDPVLGRDFEIRQMVDILTRRRQNNPILTGEAGVGKTAVVEGFALRIADGDVPPPLAERHAAHARSGAAAGRRGHQGRIRESPEGPDRRSEDLAQPRSFCSSTKPTP